MGEKIFLLEIRNYRKKSRREIWGVAQTMDCGKNIRMVQHLQKIKQRLRTLYPNKWNMDLFSDDTAYGSTISPNLNFSDTLLDTVIPKVLK